jgi:hypothetical protein
VESGRKKREKRGKRKGKTWKLGERQRRLREVGCLANQLN